MEQDSRMEIRLNSELKERFQALCQELGLNESEFVRTKIAEFVAMAEMVKKSARTKKP